MRRGVRDDPTALSGCVRRLPKRVHGNAHERLAARGRHVRCRESAQAADCELSSSRIVNRLGFDPLHSNAIRELHHRRAPCTRASAVAAGRIPRCGIHFDTFGELRRRLRRLLQQRDVCIRLEQALPALGTVGDVPGDDLHGSLQAKTPAWGRRRRCPRGRATRRPRSVLTDPRPRVSPHQSRGRPPPCKCPRPEGRGRARRARHGPIPTDSVVPQVHRPPVSGRPDRRRSPNPPGRTPRPRPTRTAPDCPPAGATEDRARSPRPTSG